MRLRCLGLIVLLASSSLFACASHDDATPSRNADETEPDARALAAPAHGPAKLGLPLADDASAHLALSLRRQDEAGLAALLGDQQDPLSPRYHAWLTPAQYGDRFGLAEVDYARVVDWLESSGFTVTRYPNRLFLEASGTVAKVRALLGVQLRVASHNGRVFRSYGEAIVLPGDIAPFIVKVGGLDTRVRLHHRLNVDWYGSTIQVLGADDLRTLYDIPTSDTGAAGLTLVVLGTQEGTQPDQNDNPTAPFVAPDAMAIQTYLSTLSNATATYNPIVLPNTDDDFDTAGSNAEYQLDVEMQSVGAPNAKDLDLVLSPASVVFETGAQYIVNNLSSAVAVSTSLGLCESEEIDYAGGAVSDTTSDAYLMRQAVQQGLAEGQMWFAASGDSGADDCNDETSGTGNGFGGGNATVDFPCSLPEILCVGGTEFNGNGTWSSSGALTAYFPEEVCNEGSDGVGGGGGQSLLYPKPSWQTGVGPKASDGQRDLPDIALIAASNTPGVVDYDCGNGQDSCPDAGSGLPGLDITGGTSVASPLSAGIFAHLAGQIGCRQGDIHATLYALGAAQQNGGSQPFHDITVGDNDWEDPANKTITGFTAVPGYDLASGWGSLDVAKLIASWPPCATTDGGDLQRDSGTGSADAATGAHDAGTPERLDSGLAGTADAGRPHDGGKDSADGQEAPASSGGCGCTAAGAPPPRGWWIAACVLGFAARRRRRMGSRTLHARCRG